MAIQRNSHPPRSYIFLACQQWITCYRFLTWSLIGNNGFAASAEVIRYFNAKPVFVDIRVDNFNIDPGEIESSITEKTRAILPVHIGGWPADLDAIYEIAERYNLAVVEDAAHAFPCKYRGRMIGSAQDRSRYHFPHVVAFFTPRKPSQQARGECW